MIGRVHLAASNDAYGKASVSALRMNAMLARERPSAVWASDTDANWFGKWCGVYTCRE